MHTNTIAIAIKMQNFQRFFFFFLFVLPHIILNAYNNRQSKKCAYILQTTGSVWQLVELGATKVRIA